MPPPRRKPAAVSLDVDLYERSRERARSLGFPTWSAYIVQLIRNDIAAGGGMSIVQDAPAVYATPDIEPASCAPAKTTAASTITAPPPSPAPMETANIVRLPKLHLTSTPSTAVPSKTKRA